MFCVSDVAKRVLEDVRRTGAVIGGDHVLCDLGHTGTNGVGAEKRLERLSELNSFDAAILPDEDLLKEALVDLPPDVR